MKKNNNLQVFILLGIVVLIPFAIVVYRIFVANNSNSQGTSNTPQEIVTSNITDTAATVSWVTPSEAQGYINYGNSINNFPLKQNDYRDGNSVGKYNTHYVEIKNLSPDTRYYFEIISNGADFDREGDLAFSFKTLPSGAVITSAESISGSINTTSSETVVYAHVTDGSTVSSSASAHITSGNFSFNKNSFRNVNTGEAYDLEGAVVVVSATDGDLKRGSGEIDAQATRITDIATSAGGAQYDPQETISQAQTAITSTPTPSLNLVSPTPSSGTGALQNILTDKVSSGRELTDPLVPYSVFISNLSQTGFCMNWLTKQSTTGFITYTRASSTSPITVNDDRDTAGKVTRYTHYVCVENQTFTNGESVAVQIYSNDVAYGSSFTATSSFLVSIPQVVTAAPTLVTIGGTVTKSYSANVQASARDTIISARFVSATSQSTWVSIPPQTNNTWTLPFSGLLSSDLTAYFTTTNANYAMTANGEFNSGLERVAATNANTIAFNLDPGLSIYSPTHQSEVGQAFKLEGTSTPNSSVALSVNGQTSSSVTANAGGFWQATLSAQNVGTFRIGASSTQGESVSISLIISSTAPSVDVSDLPNTGLTDHIDSVFIAIGFGIILIVAGILLFISIGRRRSVRLN